MREQAAPLEQQQMLGAENRLFQQGLLSSSSGAERIGALYEAQRRADVQRQMQGYGMAQDVQQSLFNRGLQGMEAGIGIEGLPGTLMQQSIGASGGQQAASGRAAEFTYSQGMNTGNIISGFFGSLGGSLANYGMYGGGQGGGGGYQMPGTYSSPGGGTAGGYSWGSQAPAQWSMFGGR